MEKTLKQKLARIMREQNFFRNFTLEPTSETTDAGITLHDHHIMIEYNPNWWDMYGDESLEKYLDKKNVPHEKALEVLLRDVMHHEIGHRRSRRYRGCPETPQKSLEYFINPLCEATGIENRGALQYLSNMLQDVIDNTIIKKVSPTQGITPGTGLYLAYKERAKTSEGGVSKLYEAYMRLNLFCNGDTHDYKLLKEHFNYDEDVNLAIQNFLEKTGIGELRYDKPELRRYMMDEENWTLFSKVFGEEFAKFLPEPQGGGGFGEPLIGSGGGQPQQGKGESSEPGEGQGDQSSGGQGEEGEGDGQEEQNDPGQGNGAREDKFDPNDGFGGELNSSSGKRQAIQAGLKAGTEPGWMTNFEYLEGLYELLAADKVFELTPPDMKSKTYPLIDLQDREFDFEEDSISDIIGLEYDTDVLGVTLRAGKLKYDIPAKVTKGVSKTPDLVLAMLDTSGSMGGPMPEGDGLGEVVNPKAPGRQQWNYNSKYHVALIAHFMAIERFYELGVEERDVYFANFSRKTILEQGLQASKRAALCPQFGGTTLDVGKIEDLLSKRDSIVFTISDGEIWNDDEVLKTIEEHCDPSTYFHVQIGGDSNFSLGLRKRGYVAQNVMKEEELYNFVIDLTEVLYGE